MIRDMAMRVGIAGPFSGPRRAYGNLLRQAAEAAGTGFDLVFADDKALPACACAAAEQLIAASVQAVIGHFNSDCARIAGPLYRRAGIPFLMPASTASDLVVSTGGIRICPTDAQQISAMVTWLSESPLSPEIEEDGSPYGARLAGILREALASDAPHIAPVPRHRVRVVLGTHRAVASRILDATRARQVFLVPDDCAIDEFEEMLGGYSGKSVFVAQPKPDFARAVAIAFELLARGSGAGGDLKTALRSDRMIANGQFVGVAFSISRLDTGKASLQGAIQTREHLG